MKQLMSSMILAVLAFQSFACSGSSDAVEVEVEETVLDATDVPEEDTAATAVAPQGVQLLSPSELDAQLGELAPGDPETQPVELELLGSSAELVEELYGEDVWGYAARVEADARRALGAGSNPTEL